MKRMLFGAAALAAAASLLHSASSASDPRPLVTTQPDPTADVAPYFVSDSDPRWSSADWSRRGHRGASEQDQVRLRHLQREPLLRPRIRDLPRRRTDSIPTESSARARRYAGLHPDLPRHRDRQDGHGSAVPRRAGAKRDPSRTAPTIRTRPRGQARRARTASRKWTNSRKSSGAAMRAPAATKARSEGNPVRASRHGAYRLRHDPVLLALREPIHPLRQHLRHRRHALDAQRHRDDRRTVRRNAMGQAPEQPVQPNRDRIYRRHQRHDQRQDLCGGRHDGGPAARQRSAALVGLGIR